MNKDDLISKVLYLPSQFRIRGNISMISLLKESGYFEMYDQVNEAEITKALNEHPECINDWIMLSEDKRCSSGWYITENENGKYIVGYYPAEEFEITEYCDVKEACAAFIKLEIEAIRN